MPLNPSNTRSFHKKLYAGQLESITLLKRGDNQRQGTVRSVLLFNCRHSIFHRQGETYQGDQTSGDFVTWHIPREELDRVGIEYLNPLDRIVDKEGRVWEQEAPTQSRLKLWEGHICIDCVRVS